jgi:hypothetical protein
MWGGAVHRGELPSLSSGAVGGGGVGPKGGGVRTPRFKDAVVLDGHVFQITAQALKPVPGFWLARENSTKVCQRLVKLSDWSLKWDHAKQRWELP